MKYPLVRVMALGGFPVTVMCRVVKFSPQGCYQLLARPVTRRDYENALLTPRRDRRAQRRRGNWLPVHRR